MVVLLPAGLRRSVAGLAITRYAVHYRDKKAADMRTLRQQRLSVSAHPVFLSRLASSSSTGCSALSMLCVVVVVLTLVVLAASGREKTDAAPQAAAPRAFIASTGFFRAFSVMAFAFTCHTVAFPVYLELERPSVARMMNVTYLGMVIALVLYATLAIAGYFEYSQTRDGVEGDVLINIAKSEAPTVSAIVRIAFVTSIIG